ncbi:MAG: SurA N-terminal domain-containing protein [Verrucomicrobia bacterium]|nr:SurA N-terminal domain-containing protein [Verrucomicrobiota bacterium]
MIEKIHRYKALLVFGLVLVAAAFVFGDFSRGRRNSVGGGTAILRIAGKTYDDKAYNKLGNAPVSLAQIILRSGDFTPYQFVFELAKGASSESDLAEKFLVGRMLLRDAKDEFGIHPGDVEVSAFIRSMKAFTGPGQAFDEKKYRAFIDKDIGRLGLTENDLLALASDILAHRKLKTLLNAGLGTDRDTVAKDLALKKQQITADLTRLDLAPFEDKIQPSEEEIKAYWEPIKDGFKTTPRRKFSYILVTPPLPPDAAAAAEPKETLAEAAASDEAKAAARKKKEEEKALRAAKNAEERRKIQLETDSKVDDFTYQIEQDKGAGFEDQAKAIGWEIKTTDLFTLSEAPADLAIKVRASSRNSKAADELFRIQETSDPVSRFAPPIPVGDSQWLIGRLDGEEKSREKTYSEARAEARAQFIAEKAAADLKAAAEDAITKIKASLAAGKSFAEAAKDAGLAEAKAVKDITSSYKPEGATEPQNLFQAASNVDPGAIADPIIESDRAFILHVVKREVVKDPSNASAVDSAVTAAITSNETYVFDSWLASRIEAAKVEQLYKRR